MDNAEAKRKDDGASEDGSAEGRVRVSQRPLDHHDPAERGDAGMSREDLSALESFGDRRRVAGARDLGACVTYLREG